MVSKTIDERVLRRAMDAVHRYINSNIKVIDYTGPTVVYANVGQHCMTHVVSLPETPNKLFVLCHYGDRPDRAGSELGQCLLNFMGFMPEMPNYVRGQATNGRKTIPVIGFFVDKEEYESSPNVQMVRN